MVSSPTSELSTSSSPVSCQLYKCILFCILSYVDDKEEVSIIFYDRALEESGYSTVQYSTVLLSKEVICIL